MGSAKIRASAIILTPIVDGDAPNNSIFSDAGNSGAFTNKTPAGTVTAVGAVSSADAFGKLAKNASGTTIAAKKAVSKKADGSIVVSDSDSVDGQKPYAITAAAILDDAFGQLYLFGRNVPGALTGLGFVAGDSIYISQTAGFTNDPGSFTGNDDTITFIGIADCADNTMSATATDLVMIRQELTSP